MSALDVNLEALAAVVSDALCGQCCASEIILHLVTSTFVKLADPLATLFNARTESKVHSKLQLSYYDDDLHIERAFRVQTSGTYSMLVWRDSGEEVILDVQGIIGQCLLPPLRRMR
jgi:hypothetical protein